MNNSFPHSSYCCLLPSNYHFAPEALPEYVTTPNYSIASFSRFLFYFLDWMNSYTVKLRITDTPLIRTPQYYGQFGILCSWGKNALFLTRLKRTLSLATSVSILTEFDCTATKLRALVSRSCIFARSPLGRFRSITLLARPFRGTALKTKIPTPRHDQYLTHAHNYTTVPRQPWTAVSSFSGLSSMPFGI